DRRELGEALHDPEHDGLEDARGALPSSATGTSRRRAGRIVPVQGPGTASESRCGPVISTPDVLLDWSSDVDDCAGGPSVGPGTRALDEGFHCPWEPCLMALLLLVRHAMTEATGRRLSGSTPGIHLSPEGEAQAARLAERLGALRLD